MVDESEFPMTISCRLQRMTMSAALPRSNAPSRMEAAMEEDIHRLFHTMDDLMIYTKKESKKECFKILYQDIHVLDVE